MEGWHRRAPQAWGAGRTKPTQQVGRELGGPPPIPAPHPCKTTVTLFLALRTAWGDGQRGQSSPVTARLSTGMRWSPPSSATLQRATGGKGAAMPAAVRSGSRDTAAGMPRRERCGRQGPLGAGRVLGQDPPAPQLPSCLQPLAPASLRDGPDSLGVQSSSSGVGPRGVQPWFCLMAGWLCIRHLTALGLSFPL